MLAVAGAWLVLAQSVQRQDRYLLPAIPLLAAVVGGARGGRWLAPLSLQHGMGYTDRLHIHLFGDTRGT